MMYLPVTVAQRDIAAYEQNYWGPTGPPVSVGQCKRHSKTQVTCVASIIVGGEWVRTTDWALLLRHDGIVRVRPGEFQVTIHA